MTRLRTFVLVSVVVVLSGRTPVGQGYTAPRTPWGDPDLQGSHEGNYTMRNILSGARADDVTRLR